LPFIIELGVDQLKNLLERVHTSVGENKVFHVEDDALERAALNGEFVFAFKVLDRPALGEEFGELLRRFRNVRQVPEKVRLFTVEGYCLAAICPDADRRAFCVAISFELLQAVLALWPFNFDDDVRGGGGILFPNHDVRCLLVDRRTEVDRLFYGYALLRVAVVIH